jgi:hypothetical protein
MENAVHLERQAGALLASIHPQVQYHCRHLFVITFLAIHKIARDNDDETTFQIIAGLYKAVFSIDIPRVSQSRLRIRVTEKQLLFYLFF